MSDPAALNTENFDNMTAAEFEQRLPDLLSSGPSSLLDDGRYATFFEKNPDCAGLVRDLQAIADAARLMFQPEDEPEAETEEEPTDELWSRIKNKLGTSSTDEEPAI